jgi:RNA polymerase sigma factor (sigma-70 family)
MDYFPAKVVENVCEIEDFLKQIPPRLRTAVYQRFFKNMTMEEIGKENNYSRETARRYINDGLDKIREIIS